MNQKILVEDTKSKLHVNLDHSKTTEGAGGVVAHTCNPALREDNVTVANFRAVCTGSLTTEDLLFSLIPKQNKTTKLERRGVKYLIICLSAFGNRVLSCSLACPVICYVA